MTRSNRVRPFRLLRPVLCTAVLTLLVPTGLSAQADSREVSPQFSEEWSETSVPDEVDWSDEVPAHLGTVEGTAYLDRDGQREIAEVNTILLAGDRVQTAGGRVEVLFADGGALTLDQDTRLEFLSDTLINLQEGRIRLTLARGATEYRVDGAGTTAWIRASGEYRIAVGDSRSATPDMQLTVIRGMAELSSPFGRTLVRAGYEASASAQTTPSAPYAVAVSRWDEFDRWTDARRDERYGFTSASYLPSEIRYYGGTLDRHGSWRHESPYGYVWYPHVDVHWQPYSVGRWSFTAAYGWVWIGADRWSWPTHHYGRWGLSNSRWYWIPDRRWAPAWVAWASSPGYVGWSPLGYNNRPLISISIGRTSGWRAWNLAPARSFHSRVVVAQRARLNAVPRDTRFVVGRRGPTRPAGVPDRPRVISAASAPSRGLGSSVAAPRAGVRSDRAPSSVAPNRQVIAPRGAETPRVDSGVQVSRPGPSAVGRPRATVSPGVNSRAPRQGSGVSQGVSPQPQPRQTIPQRRVLTPRAPVERAPVSPGVRTRAPQRAPQNAPPARVETGTARPRVQPRSRVESSPPASRPPAVSQRSSAPRERSAAPAPAPRPQRVERSEPAARSAPARAPSESRSSGGASAGGRAVPRGR